MSRLLCVVPSRGRPDNIKRLRDTMAATCRGDTTLIVGLDEDDTDRWRYPADVQTEVRPGLRRVVAWVNAMSVPRTGEFDYIGHFGDDNVPRTVGWDVNVMAALEKTPFAFANDLYPRLPGSLCCHIFCRSEVITALGYLGPPSLKHMFVDNVWWEWGQRVGISYLHDVVLEHLHFTNGKAFCDQSYWESSKLMAEDQVAFEDYCQDPQGLAADVAKLRRLGG